jgi:hypothetical protein
MPTIVLNDFEMYYEARGHGTPLLLLHGGMGIGDDWRHVDDRPILAAHSPSGNARKTSSPCSMVSASNASRRLA